MDEIPLNAASPIVNLSSLFVVRYRDLMPQWWKELTESKELANLKASLYVITMDLILALYKVFAARLH